MSDEQTIRDALEVLAVCDGVFPGRAESAIAALDRLVAERDMLERTQGQLAEAVAALDGAAACTDDEKYGDWRDDPGNYGE